MRIKCMEIKVNIFLELKQYICLHILPNLETFLIKSGSN